MGKLNFTNDIATESISPAQVSLASNPNYVQFEQIGYSPNDNTVNITLAVNNTSGYKEEASITFENTTQTPFTLKATRKEDEVNDTTFFLHLDKSITAENIRACMMKNSFLRSNFEISIPPAIDNGVIRNGQVIHITTKAASSGATFTIIPPKDPKFITIGGDTAKIINIVSTSEQKLRTELTVISSGIINENDYYGDIVIREKDTGVIHTLWGTRLKIGIESIMKLGLDSLQNYLLSSYLSSNALHIQYALSIIPFFKAYFNVTISPTDDKTVIIEAKNTGTDYGFYIDSYDKRYLNIKSNIEDNKYNSDCEIQLDLYKDTGIFLGEDDKNMLGKFVTTLSKAYFNQPLWFDINTIAQKVYSDQFLNAVGWCSAGTATDYRFVAKRFNGINTETFYVSDVLYILTGYDRSLEKNNLSQYIYDTVQNNLVKPLTKQPTLTHTKGQTHYFNFILSDPQHCHKEGVDEYQLSIQYKLYTQSGKHLGSITGYGGDHKKMDVVNTISLNLDGVTGKYDNVGRVDACLSRDGVTVSEPLKFNILPECLHKVNDFAFLNSLGGWSSFNFGGTEQTDFKTETTTIYKTQTPAYKIHSQIESVYSKQAKEQFVVQTSPIKAEVADWLKELSSSIAVYELSTKRYIIVEELNVKHNTKDDLFTLQMKYHYSDM